jgi:hypothetical protein
MDEALSRFLELVRREMSAEDVSVVPRGTTAKGAATLVAPLGEAEELVVRFDVTPDDADARLRRLEMLVNAFATALEAGAAEGGAAKSPRATPRSLRDELRTLATRAGALDALVIDAHSPIVWGAVLGVRTQPEGAKVIPLTRNARERVDKIQDSHRDLIAALDMDNDDDDDETDDGRISAAPPEVTSPLSERAVAEVRALPVVNALHRGAHLAQAVRKEDYGWVARSFAAIYVLVLVYDRAFDELRAERALREGLPIIERLVLALPPMDPDPEPMGGVVAIRMRRRR